MIFTDSLNQKWKRVTTNSKINVQWYGVASSRPGHGYTVDTRSKFITIRDYIYSHPAYNTIYVPTDSSLLSGSYYYISDSILFNKPINIIGDGTYGAPTSKIMFAGHKSGFVFQYSYGSHAFFMSVQNLNITSSSSIIGGVIDITKHAIITRVGTQIENLVIDQFDGNGIHISACSDTTNGDNNNYGNSDGSSIKDVWITHCTNGIFIEGCDANTIYIINSSTNQNRRWGIYDNGLLGNMILKPHAAFNGAGGLTGQNTVVTYGGLKYAAIPGHDGYFGDASDSNYAKRPDTTLGTYWQIVDTVLIGVGAWNATTRYYSGGPIAIVNQNAFTNIVNSYTESFQPPIWLKYRSKVDGGDNGAGVRGGSYEIVSSGIKYIYNSSVGLVSINNAIQDTTQKYLTISKPAIDYEAPLVAYNDQAKSGTVSVAKFETSGSGAYLKVKNYYTTGYIVYNVDDWVFQTNGFNTVGLLNAGGFYPGSNNAQDIGSASTKWRTGYFSTSSYSPLIIGGSSSGGYLTLSSTSHATKGKIIFGSTSVYDEANGYLGINTTTPSTYFDLNSDKVRIRTAKTPSSANDTGNAGDICWDSDYIYICVATNTWKRAAISTW